MMQRPQRGDPFWIWMLHGWEAFSWAIIGLLILQTTLGSAPAPEKYGSLALMGILALGWVVVRARPNRPPGAGYAYLALLVLVVGSLAYLRDGFGVLYTLALPQFVIFANGVRSAIVSSGLGALAITVGGLTREGWTTGNVTANVISSLAVYAVSITLTLLTPRALEIRDERAQLRKQLAGAEAEVADLQRRQGAAEERERLAREIHDTLAQGFASIIVLAEAARTGLATDSVRSAQQLTSIEQTARENLAEARALVGSGARSAAPGASADALRRTLDRFTEDTGIAVSAELPDLDLDQPTRIALLRCTQESLANVRKHADASAVGVVLTAGPDAVELEITDDGRGFLVAEAAGFGLDGMRRRLAELGGELTVTSSPGDGTRVLAVLPAKLPAKGSPA
ncbi:sensor histidine kinase [Streptomyces sp. A7024]|uniref:Oxygen sensor histidine kinase NreB n=1 Tax=Streptomyces coryli TaxID=1128680 RepID=A0A6G4U6M5_9ACTN|nr:sensor histidine kinase [Streptomyces coryli]NGN67889.1 sensor histidine kinase [Streptomyces coryli]